LFGDDVVDKMKAISDDNKMAQKVSIEDAFGFPTRGGGRGGSRYILNPKLRFRGGFGGSRGHFLGHRRDNRPDNRDRPPLRGGRGKKLYHQ